MHQVRLEQQVLLGLLERRAQLERQVRRVLQALLELQVQQVLPVQLELQVQRLQVRQE